MGLPVTKVGWSKWEKEKRLGNRAYGSGSETLRRCGIHRSMGNRGLYYACFGSKVRGRGVFLAFGQAAFGGYHPDLAPGDLWGGILINPSAPTGIATVASVTIELDLPPGVEITGYERHQDGHGFGVRWPLPERCRCERCGHEDRAHIEFKTSPQAIRDLDVWGQPSFWIYQAPFHRCARCDYRQHLIPPFKRKDTAYTYRFEQFVLRSLIGSTAEDVARRLGISAETVEHIVENQLAEERRIDPQRSITDIGLDELSLKKRHRLYVTLMTDLSDPARPQILAVARGKDTAAALKCLDLLSEEQRQQVRTHRVDMGSAYPAACAERLTNSRAVTDRFHVAKKFNEAVDALRKK